MARYQLYLLDRFGRAIKREDHDCSNDGAAVLQGRSLCQEHDVDVWREDRRVARVHRGDDKALGGKKVGCPPLSLF